MKRLSMLILALILAALACGTQTPSTPFPTPASSIFDSAPTAHGFFPSPPRISTDSVLEIYKDIGNHADFVLLQENVPWNDFVNSVDGQSQRRTDIINQVTLARQNHLDYIFIVDGLNGLNRSQFSGLPFGWDASFANPNIRAAYTNYTLWVVRMFHPRYLGLASEINTYMDTHPEDVKNFISLYNEIYKAVKLEAPHTKVFVTFQWEELNNLIPQIASGRTRLHPNWNQVEAFEPNLDVWAISSYPFVAFQSGADIPADYYAPLLSQTSKPLAVAEGGFTSEPAGPIKGTPEDQVAYLNAIHNQIGPRLAFWVYLLLEDFDLDSYSGYMKANGVSSTDVDTLGMFASVGLSNSDGTAKPALGLWDSFRANQ
ncbi:MAG TPA: hypothetical protein VLX61_08885 [Anaerolineales bacterium]|nr:hypothetical protein [Anaerolineales bacterium]